MTETVTGVVDQVQEKSSEKGKIFWKINLADNADTYFVWSKKLLEEAGEIYNKKVCITHDAGEYPRVKKIEVLSGEAAHPGESKDATKGQNSDKQPISRGTNDETAKRIARSVALKLCIGDQGYPFLKIPENLEKMFKTADDLVDYILTGKAPAKKTK